MTFSKSETFILSGILFAWIQLVFGHPEQAFFTLTVIIATSLMIIIEYLKIRK